MYRDASRIFEKVLSKSSEDGSSKNNRKRKRGLGGEGLGLKSLVFQEGVKNKSKTFAVVCESLKFKEAIDTVLSAAGVRINDLARNEALAYVMLYDHLFGKGIKGGGTVKRAIQTNNDKLQNGLKMAMKMKGVAQKSALVNQKLQNVPKFPRYARVNLLKTSVNEVVERLSGVEVKIDEHVPYLLQFPHATDLHNHPLVLSGELILQDKSSCLPVYGLVDAMNGDLGVTGLAKVDVIDAAAAPGNKTSQLACDFRKVIAFDKSQSRLSLLNARMKVAGAASKVQSHCADFLKVKPENPDFEGVRGILLDPSCSGSGMIGRIEHAMSSPGQERLKSLETFQRDCLCHALSFPQVKWVSYSTCSIHREENESVVLHALERFPEFELFHVLPKWKRRGSGEENAVHRMVRVDPYQDETSGFFVALFVRRQDSRKKVKMRERSKRRRKEKRLKKQQKSKQHQGP